MFQFLAIVIQAIVVYKWILMARILLTWLPSIDWYSQPFRFLAAITDPLLEPFRRLIPPIGMVDISAMALFLVLSVVQSLLAGLMGASAGSFF